MCVIKVTEPLRVGRSGKSSQGGDVDIWITRRELSCSGQGEKSSEVVPSLQVGMSLNVQEAKRRPMWLGRSEQGGKCRLWRGPDVQGSVSQAEGWNLSEVGSHWKVLSSRVTWSGCIFRWSRWQLRGVDKSGAGAEAESLAGSRRHLPAARQNWWGLGVMWMHQGEGRGVGIRDV